MKVYSELSSNKNEHTTVTKNQSTDNCIEAHLILKSKGTSKSNKVASRRICWVFSLRSE